jgi:hypothetical protein
MLVNIAQAYGQRDMQQHSICYQNWHPDTYDKFAVLKLQTGPRLRVLPEDYLAFPQSRAQGCRTNEFFGYLVVAIVDSHGHAF